MGLIYEAAPKLIRARVAEIYGTQAHLGRLLGISRQALAGRVRATGESPYLHGWWEGLLVLPVGSLAAGSYPEREVDYLRAAVALEDAKAKWPGVYAMRLRFPSPQRLAGNAARRGARIKREGGCKP